MRLVQLVILFFGLSIIAHAEDLRINTQALSQTLSNYIVLDARPAELYQAQHIKGALSFPVSLTYENQKLDGRISNPDKIQNILRNLGISIQSPIVIYDDGYLMDAARLFWTLEVYGLQHVKVLNAGFDRWVHQGLPTDDVTPSVESSDYVAQINDGRIATKLKTLIATKSPDQLVIDARSAIHYQGQKSSAQRSGHILSALNYPASENISKIDNFAELQPVDELLKFYSDIPKNKKIVAYCAIGRIASANYLALRELGYDVSVYDASWNEWGNDFHLPIVNPSEQP